MKTKNKRCIVSVVIFKDSKLNKTLRDKGITLPYSGEIRQGFLRGYKAE